MYQSKVPGKSLISTYSILGVVANLSLSGVGAYSRLGDNSRLGAYSNKYGKLKIWLTFIFFVAYVKNLYFSTWETCEENLSNRSSE